MAVLVPEGFALASLANDAERDVVQALLRGLSDAWLVLPSVGLHTADRDRELDVVLVHQQFGVIDLEVKAHRVVIERGEWCFGARRQRFDVPPPEQAKGNAYALRDLLRTHLSHLPHLRVNWAIALPNTERVDGALPPDVVADQLVLAPDLDDLTGAIEVIGILGYTTYDLTADDVAWIVAVLRPDAEFVLDPTPAWPGPGRCSTTCATPRSASWPSSTSTPACWPPATPEPARPAWPCGGPATPSPARSGCC